MRFTLVNHVAQPANELKAAHMKPDDGLATEE